MFRFVGNDDDDSEITDHKTRKITSSDDLGVYVSEQMTWTPTRADLCNFDATVSSNLSVFSMLKMIIYPQCPRIDLNKRFLPRPKTTTA